MRQRGAREEFDYVIVGGGTAGSVLARRLTEDNKTVCVLEAGPPDNSPFIHLPAEFIKILFNPKYTWQFKTEPNNATGGRRIGTVQGKTLGGSSSINGMGCNRGQRADFDSWAQKGNRGWSYSEVLPYFKRSEKRIGQSNNRYRGTEGPLAVTDCDWHHPLCEAFIAGAMSMGLPRNPDYNADSQSGTGYYQRWIHKGRRVSAATGYLRGLLPASRLDVRTNVQATSIVLDGKSAEGVRYMHGPGSAVHAVYARREVILCAGAANTPKLLLLSGIGGQEALPQPGTALQHELNGVGKNLQDHYAVRFVAKVKDVDTINNSAKGIRLGLEMGKWLMGRPSILGVGPTIAYAFCNSETVLGEPDLQFVFTPGSFVESIPGLLDDFPGMTAGCYQLRPESRGYVRLQSNNPFDDPIIQPNYLTHETDQRALVNGLKLTRRILATAPMQPYYVSEKSPGAAVASDDEILDYARNHGNTAYHLMGTCRMGPDADNEAVVDEQLRVKGMQRLRIVDASIMPGIPSANLAASVLMIAEKAADLITGRPPLAAVDLPDVDFAPSFATS